MGNGLAEGGINFVVAAFVATWLGLGAMAIRVNGAVKRGKAELDAAQKGEFRT